MAVKIFFCYAHEDESLLQGLETQLRILRRQGLIDTWYDRDISAGADWEQEIDKRLNTAQIILLLVSPDFMASDYCYGKEMKRAMERHEGGETRVIPIILRPTMWQGEPLGGLQALPKDGIPVKDRSWHTIDDAFYSIAVGIKKAVEDFLGLESYPEHVAKAISERYFQLEDAATFLLGVPIPLTSSDTYQLTSLRGTFGYKRPFTKGAMYWSEQGGAHPVYGAIGYLFQSKNDIGRFGFPLTGEIQAGVSPQGTGGLFQRFEGAWDYPDDIDWPPVRHFGATIYWSEKYGEYATSGGIGVCYERLGGTGSILGFPTSQETDAAQSPYETTGRYQDFEGGFIVWCEKYNVFAIAEPILTVYNTFGGSRGRFGFPKAKAIFDTDHPNWSLQEFEGGVICAAE